MEKFDLLMLLKSPGEVAYFGPLSQLSAYFSTHFAGVQPCPAGINIADYALDTLAQLSARKGDDAVDIAAVFRQSDFAKQVWSEIELGESKQQQAVVSHDAVVIDAAQSSAVSDPADDSSLPPLKHASFLRQVRFLTPRFFLNQVRDRAGLLARVSAPLMYAFWMGTLFLQLGNSSNDIWLRMPLMYTFVVEAQFSCAIIFPALFQARLIYFRELGSRMYSAESYYFARLLADLPFSIGESMLFCVILYFASGLSLASGGTPFALFCLIYWLNRMMGLAFAEMVASIAPIAEAANNILATSHSVLQLVSYDSLLTRP